MSEEKTLCQWCDDHADGFYECCWGGSCPYQCAWADVFECCDPYGETAEKLKDNK